VSVRDVNQQALGTGAVTMNGGKLDIALKSGVTSIGLSNNLNVTASSVLQYDGAGSIAFDLFGGINGSPSAVLTVQGFLNNSATADRLRLYGNFTNNAQIMISTPGDELELAPYNASGNQTYNGAISGTGGRFTLRGSGTATLAGANTFNDSGVVANGSGPSGYSIYMSSGNLGIGADSSVDFSAYTLSGGVAAGTSPLGTGTVGINNNGSAEGGNCSFFAAGGAHTVANPIIYTTATNTFTVSVTGSNNLTFSGTVNLNGADNTGTNRVWNVSNTGLTTISGAIGDAALICGLTKSGSGRLALDGANTYTGPTLISAGTLYVDGTVAGTVTATNGILGGLGTISGAAAVQSPGTLAPGTAAIGTLTFSSNLTLAGNGLFKVNKSLGQSNDIASVSGTLSASGSGTVTVTNLNSGNAIVPGDRFMLFNKLVGGAGSLNVTGAGMVWSNGLAVDGSITALSVVSTVNTNATNITFSVTGGGTTLNLTWPADHTGWRLETQSNAVAIGLNPTNTAWTTVAGSTLVNTTNFPIAGKGAVFYRLIYP
jgi:autotransporter-associated beta strand protein